MTSNSFQAKLFIRGKHLCPVIVHKAHYSVQSEEEKFLLDIVLTLGGEKVAGEADGRLVAGQLHGVQIFVGRFIELRAEIIEPAPRVVDEQQGDDFPRSWGQIGLAP